MTRRNTFSRGPWSLARAGLAPVGLTIAALAGAVPTPLASQTVPMPRLGGVLEERARTEQLRGTVGAEGFLLRRTAPEGGCGPEDGLCWALLSPDVAAIWNDAIPIEGNDGPLWAGRGLNGRFRGGIVARWGPVEFVLAPELLVSQNQAFLRFPSADPTRDPFASPWYVGRNSADLPLRFGDRTLVRLDPGQSTLSIEAGPARLFASTANEWWGPGLRNALLLSSHAPGFPRVGVETARPWRTGIGAVEARWFVGVLAESDHFDDDGGNDRRSLTGMAVTLAPSGVRNLTVGVARLVVAPLDGVGDLPGRAFHALTRWDPFPDSPGGDPTPRSDALLSAFVRWIHPAAGVEIWGEWGRSEPPTSLRQALTAPQQSQAWTLGMQFVDPLERGGALRLQTEATMLEQTPILQDRPVPPSWYTGRAAAHGFTHEGQVLGASIGPGGSSQWIAFDYLSEPWSLGAFLERVRHSNDVLYLRAAPDFHRHDVSVRWGVRGDLARGDSRLSVDASYGVRLNYLFENDFAFEESFRTLDRWGWRVVVGVEGGGAR